MRVQENYDPNQPVCENQDDFNVAFRKAVRHYNKHEMKRARPMLMVYMLVWLVFLVWAIILAAQVPQGANRQMHMVFAILAAPVYVLAYYACALLPQSSNKFDSIEMM